MVNLRVVRNHESVLLGLRFDFSKALSRNATPISSKSMSRCRT